LPRRDNLKQTAWGWQLAAPAKLKSAIRFAVMNPDIRWKQRFQNFDRAYALLSEALERKPEALSLLEKEGVIQRFEYTFELAWKTLKDYLEEGGLVISPGHSAPGNQRSLCRQSDRGRAGLDQHAGQSQSSLAHV
jgi:hypothetical protein